MIWLDMEHIPYESGAFKEIKFSKLIVVLAEFETPNILSMSDHVDAFFEENIKQR